MDIQYSARFLDIHNSIYGYPKLDFWMSKNWIMDIQKSFRILDIQKSLDIHKSNFGYPKIYFWISQNQAD